MSDERENAKSYLRGYEDGLRDAWSDLIGLTTKGYRGREIQILAKGRMAGLSDKVRAKRRELEAELEISLSEAVQQDEPASGVRPGSAYLIRYTHPSRDLEVFKELISEGLPGLCVHRVDPGRLAERLGEQCRIVWLTKTELSSDSSKGICERDFQCVSPSGLDQLTTLVIEFLRENPSSVIMIGGLEYLLTYNDFVSVLRFLQTLKDRVILTQSVLLVPYEPSTLDPKSVKNLEKEMEGML